jgi:predicted DsbA family dithiol-disulfide isomerase
LGTAGKMGISSVPTFVLNHQSVVGAQPYQVLEQFLMKNGIKRR